PLVLILTGVSKAQNSQYILNTKSACRIRIRYITLIVLACRLKSYMENTTLSMHEVLLKNFIEDIRPEDEEIRKEVDLGYSWDGQCAILFEIRPAWNDSGKVLELPFAKLQYVK